SNLIVQALTNEPMTVNGDGSQTRSFCYVDDLIDGIVRLMDSDDGFTGPVNLGNPTEVTVQSLAERIIEITGTKARIVNHDMPVDDPTRRCPDIGLAKQELGWSPKVSLDEGLRKTIEWFDRSLARPEPVVELEARRGVA